MVLWRISGYAGLDGLGGLLSSARWHTRGRRIVYLAATPAGALIEVLVHLELSPARMPKPWRLMKVRVEEGTSSERIPAEKLAGNWRDAPEVSARAGDEWLAGKRSALLEVPSAIVPETSNWLLNPEHPDSARIHLVEHEAFRLDSRLLRFTRGDGA
jgi:RES domain-containing protein